MRYLILSDLHSNLEATQEALARAIELGYDRVLVLGDIVGYGADPNSVMDRLRALPGLVAIRGNHDKVAAGLEEGEDFNEAARQAALWTRRALTPENLAFLKALPRGPLEFAPGKYLCHGTPLDEDDYLLEEDEAQRCFERLDFEVCFFGHSHHPGAFVLDGPRALRHAGGGGAVLGLEAGRRYLVNPGSVGQPRDRDTRCGFGIYDEARSEVSFHRHEYPVDVTRGKILAAGLPRWLGDRLLVGA